MYGIIPRPLWEKHSPPDALNRINLALRLWLIQSAERLVLVDTGIGDYRGETFDQRFDVRGPKDPLTQALQELGLSPEQITDVVISHLHFDHVGGLVIKEQDALVPLFPKARLHLHRQHYAYSKNPTQRDRGSFEPEHYQQALAYYEQAGQLVWHDGETGRLFELNKDETLEFRCSHGHTPWLMHPYTSSHIYLADLIPTAHHLPIPWVMGYDIAPGQTTKDKQSFLEFCLEKKLNLIFEHDPDSWGGQLESCPKRQFKLKQTYPAQNSRAYSASLSNALES